MTRTMYVCTALAALGPALLAAYARSPKPSDSAAATMTLNVAVDSRSGQPVTNLTQSDFQLLDNRSPRTITSFRAVSGTQQPVSVILFLDSVNMPYARSTQVRQGIRKYLMSDQGKLPYPTTISVFSDNGIQVSPSSTEASLLTATLDTYRVSLRDTTRATQYGRSALISLSLNAFGKLLAYAQNLPGRKLIICVSPGWPILSGPGVQISWREQQAIFSNIVLFSTQIRKEDVTLYDINPAGITGSQTWNTYYESFLNDPAKPSKAAFGYLALPALAVQSGGTVIETNRSLSRYIHQCLLDAQSWYEIGFNPPATSKANQYQHVVLKVDRPGLTVRTASQYYANPKWPTR